MDDDIGCFDDFLTLPQKPSTVRASSKFRPKAHTKTSRVVSVTSQTSNAVHVNDRVDSCNVTLDCDNGTRQNVDELPPLDLSNSQEHVVLRDSENLDVGFVQPDGEIDLFAEKPEKVRVLASSGESMDDIFCSDGAQETGKFQPKSVSCASKSKAKKSVSFDLPCSSDDTIKTNSLTMRIPDVHLRTDVYTDNNSQSSLTNPDGYQIDNENLTAKDMLEQLDLEDSRNILSQSSSTSGKFQPKRVIRRGDRGDMESSGAAICAMEVECPEQHFLNDDTCYSEHHASDILDDSALRSFGFTSTYCNDEHEDLPQTADFQYEFDGSNLEQNFETVSGCYVNEEIQSPNDDDPEHQRSEEVPFSNIVEGVGAGRSHMKLRKRVNRQGTHSSMEEENNEDLNVEDPNISTMNEDESDGEYGVRDAAKKKTRRSAKTTKTGHEKAAKRKGKSSKTPDVTEEVQEKKRFPRGTTRKRRQVDKVLLETPEYEINFKQIAMKDLILLAEAKERISNKEASIKGNSSSTNRDKEANHADYEENPTVESIKYFNYGSYSKRSQAPRWSKSETELLYKAICQFGTDFAMIQQLFPHRTRHQVKLKFKNEERKNPMLVHDALSDRSNDLSHIKQVIEKLQANKDQTTQDENDDPFTTEFEDAVGNDEEEGVEIQMDDVNENDLGGEVKSPEHSGDAEFEAESPIDFDDYQSVWN